jgi:hypothetical protein
MSTVAGILRDVTIVLRDGKIASVGSTSSIT